MLEHRPQLVSAAVQTFYLRDPIDMKVTVSHSVKVMVTVESSALVRGLYDYARSMQLAVLL